MRYGSLAYSILLLAFALSRSLALSVVLLLGVGFTMILTNALANGLLQGMLPDALRGRVVAAYVWVFVGVGPVIGSFLAGAASKVVGASGAVAICAVVMLVHGSWVFAHRPELRDLDLARGAPPETEFTSDESTDDHHTAA